MTDSQRLQHTLWECKYPIVFVPKYRRKALFTALRKDLGPVFRHIHLAKRQVLVLARKNQLVLSNFHVTIGHWSDGSVDLSSLSVRRRYKRE